MSNQMPAGTILAKQKIKKGEKPRFSNEEITNAAYELSLLGASKGGDARAAALNSKELSRIARYAAAIRWGHIDRDTTPFSDFA